MATKICVVCGKEFSAPPSSKKITCSAECSRERKRITHTGKSNVWSEESKKNLSLKGQTENLKKGTDAARRSPIAGAFATNQNAKHWVLKSPTNVIYECDNLNLFIREHPEWFPNPTSASSALRASAACLAGKASPSRKDRQFGQYKGWQVVWYGERIEKFNNS